MGRKDDLISRQEAMDAVEKSRRLNHHRDSKTARVHEFEHRHFLKILIDLPSAEPHWIPCSERMPENMEPVNITYVNRDPVPYYMHIKDKPFTATGIYFRGKWYWWSSTCDDILCEYGENEIDEVVDGIEVIAWMPLPKPCQEVDHDTD